MAFKLPKELEALGFKRIDNIDRLTKGDLIVIPSAADEPRLRVSLATLRKWGLNVTSSDSVTRYNCDKYSAARSVFGNQRTWYNLDQRDEGSHVLVVNVANHDRNSSYGKNKEVSLKFENANSINNSKVTVEDPVYPLMSLSTLPCDPLYPTRFRARGDAYPSTLTLEHNKKAYDALVKAIGTEAMPTTHEPLGYRTKGYANMPFFMAVASCIMSDPEFSKILSLDRVENINNVYSPRRSAYNRSLQDASNLFITAPESGDTYENNNSFNYFHCDDHEAARLALHMPREFVEQLVKHGAMLYRAAGVEEMAANVMAREVAKNMHMRFNKIIIKVRNLIKGLSAELPVLETIVEKYKSAIDSLKVPDGIAKSVGKTF